MFINVLEITNLGFGLRDLYCIQKPGVFIGLSIIPICIALLHPREQNGLADTGKCGAGFYVIATL